jgi:hypothetical protein
MSTRKYTSKRTADDIANEMYELLKQAKEGNYEEGLLAGDDLTNRIAELAQLAMPRVAVPLTLAESVVETLIEIGDSDGDARKLVGAAREQGQQLRDLILIQRGRD